MLLKLFLFLLPLALVAGEVVWKSDASSELSKEELEKALKEYVDEKYPNEVKAWKEKEVAKEKELAKEKWIQANTVSLNALMWQDNEAAKTVKKDWLGAKKYCADLELVGYSDWRLPNIDELKSIVDKKRTPTIKKEFKNTLSNSYWSSTTYASSTAYAWSVGFGAGYQNRNGKTYSLYVRCVRAGE